MSALSFLSDIPGNLGERLALALSRREVKAGRPIPLTSAFPTHQPAIIEPLEMRQLLTAVTIEVVEPLATEGGAPASFNLHRDGTSGTLGVAYRIRHDSTNNDDFVNAGAWRTAYIEDGSSSATSLTLDVADDAIAEDTESFHIELEPTFGMVSGYFQIKDNEPGIWVEATDDGSENERDPATFTIHREATGGSGPLTVYYTLGGSAKAGTVDPVTQVLSPADADYIPAAPEPGGNYRKAVIPEGQLTTTVSLAPLNDALVEGAETVSLTLVADPSAGGPFYQAPGNAGPAAAGGNFADLQARPASDGGQGRHWWVDQQVVYLEAVSEL